MTVADLFHRDEATGRLLKRKEVIWSSIAPACLDCGTTEKKHEAKGRCRACYLRWKRATDPEWRERANRIHKLGNIRNAEKFWERDRQRTPRPKDERKATCARWYEKHVTRWPIGGLVEYELIPGVWIEGTIIEKTRGACLVQFATYSARIGKKKLRSMTRREA